MRKLIRHILHCITLIASCGLAHAVDGMQWLTYPGGDGPGKGKRIVLIAADQEYRSEESMPMMAKILSKHHGFDCTVLFAVNEKGEVDPTMPQTSEGKQARVFHTTMGSAHDLQSAGLRRLIINAAYWGMGLESAITPTRSVDIVGPYQPLDSGFNYKQLGVVPKPVSAYR